MLAKRKIGEPALRFKSVFIICISIFLIGIFSGCIDSTEDVELIVLGVLGESKEFTLTDLKQLSSISGTSEYQNSYGNWAGKGVYKGVPIAKFAESIGGIQQGDILVVTSEDNYSQIFTYNNIYPSTEWEALQGTMILAYEYNGTQIPAWEDGLRIAFLPTDEKYSNDDSYATSSLEAKGAGGPKWVKFVKKLEFKRENETVTFGDGTTNHTLSWSQILKLPSINQSGRSITSLNEVSDLQYYTGVNLTYVLDVLIDLNQDFSVDIVASDGYKRPFSKDQFFGNLTFYDELGTNIGHGGPQNLSLILAYYEGDQKIGLESGPFRMALVGSDSPITSSRYWVKLVNYIEVVVY